MEVTFDPGIISMDQTILGKILCKNIRESWGVLCTCRNNRIW